jgi:hypothetical protein
VAHIGHGSSTSYYINYQKDIGTVTWYTSDVSTLTNTFWPWTTSVACITGNIEYNDCLAEAYVKDPNNGAIAAIYNDNYGWFMSNDACALSGEYCEMEFRACWSDGYEKLGDMLNQALSYMIPSAQSDPYYRWCFYERNLVGDPESPCLTVREEQQAYVTITNPHEGEVVSDTVLVTTDTYGVDTVEFYIDGTLVYTDTSDPFSYSWDTTQYTNGLHTILIKGYAAGVFKDDDQVTVTVNNIPPPYVTITNPHEGEVVSGTVLVTTETFGVDTVEFYIDGTLVYTSTSDPFSYSWDTTQYANGFHTILIKGYAAGVFKDDDQVTVIVSNVTPPTVIITNPEDGSTVSGIVEITVIEGPTDSEISSRPRIDTVEFYIDGRLMYTDTERPFAYEWDTTRVRDGPHTILVKGYSRGVFMDDDSIVVRVNNTTPYLEITNPEHESKVSGTVLVTTNTGQVEKVIFYLNGEHVHESTTAPFEFKWDTTQYEDGWYELLAEGYQGNVPVVKDAIKVRVSNLSEMSLGLLSLLILFICAKPRKQ